MSPTMLSTHLVSDEQLDAQARPPLEAATLPTECYWSPEIYRAEVERIFHHYWLCVGRAEDVPQPGDYLTMDLVGEPIIVVRDGDGEVRVHLNVCRHRGCKVAEGNGKAKTFRCPYHGWMYGLNGELRGVPDFKETRNFKKRDYPLAPIKAELWDGFIMVNFDADAAPFAEQVSNMQLFGLEKYRMSEQLTTHRWEWDLGCNWKVYVENYIEEYHVPWVHPETFQAVTPMKGWREFPELPQGQPWDVMIGQFPGVSLSDTGEAMFPVTPETAELPPEHQGMPIWMSYPGFGVINAVDSSLYYLLHPTGPERFTLRVGLMLPAETARAYADGDPEVTAACEQYARNVPTFMAEDNQVTELQQAGLRSRFATQGRYCKHEGLAWSFNKWVVDTAYRPSGLNVNGGNGRALR
jgi:choline monooxygenase